MNDNSTDWIVRVPPITSPDDNEFTTTASYHLDSYVRLFKNKIPVPAVYNDINTIIEYLKNPIRSGLWRLKADWLANAGISEYILNAINSRIESRAGKILIKYTLKAFNEDVARSALIEDIKKNTRYRITFITSLFTALAAEPEDVQRLNLPDEDRLVLDNIELDKVRDEFADAYSFFKEKIYTPNFNPIFSLKVPFCLQSGYLFLGKPVDNIDNKLICYSLHREPLEDFQTFLSKVGKIKHWSTAPLFSPEDEVLKPYFLLARLAYTYIIEEDRLHSLFTKAFDEFEQGRYENCISSIGLIAEDYLIQVFETIFRDQCPKGHTLGQLFDVIEGKLSKLFQKEPHQQPDIDQLYKQIREQIEGEKLGTSLTSVDLLKTIREVVNFIKEERLYNRDSTHARQKPPQIASIFSRRVRDNIIELIRFRNAASHKSRVHLDKFEALRTLYCLVSFITWWHLELTKVNWQDDEKTILKKMIERNGESDS